MTFEELVRFNIVEQERRESTSDFEELRIDVPIPPDVKRAIINDVDTINSNHGIDIIDLW